MKKPRSKNVISIIIPLIIIIFVCLFIDSLLPETLTDSLDFWGITPKNNIEYISDKLEINGKQFFVYSTVNSNNDDTYTIAIGEITGIKSNKYNIIDYREVDSSQLTLSEYSENSNISNYPAHEIKKHSEISGGIYVGTVPATCESVLVGDASAKMVKQSVQMNGECVEFYLYYCAVENEYPNNLTITDKNGKTYYVTPVEKDGLIYPNVEIIN